MACPDFVHEAIAEIDPVALAAARNSGDAIALLRLVNKACEDYADWCVRHTPGDEVSALRWLLGRYARRAA